MGQNNNNHVELFLVNENHNKRIVNRLEEATQLVSVIVVVVVADTELLKFMSGFGLF